MSKTALIVEDEIFVALDLERILTDAGYQVAAIAADSETALAAAPGCSFAFVDVNLRDGMTGWVRINDINTEFWEDDLNALHGIRVVTEWVDGPPTAELPGRADQWRALLARLRKPVVAANDAASA